jgi:hypothetical protein
MCLEAVFRCASSLIKPVICMCAAVSRSRSSSSVCVSVRRLSLTSVRIRCRRLSFSSEERLVKRRRTEMKSTSEERRYDVYERSSRVRARKDYGVPDVRRSFGLQEALSEPLRLPRRGEDRTPPTARGVESLGVRGEEFDGNVDETLVQKADNDASLSGHCGVDGVAGKEITE